VEEGGDYMTWFQHHVQEVDDPWDGMMIDE
jgi:hypothetical protein